MLKRYIFLVLLVSTSSLSFADLSLLCKLISFRDLIANSSTTPEELACRFGKNYALEVRGPDFHPAHSPLLTPLPGPGDKVYVYRYAAGAKFYYYYTFRNKRLYLASWEISPEFLLPGTYPKTIRECQDIFGKENLNKDNSLFYSLPQDTLRFVFDEEDHQLKKVTWSIDI